MALVCRFDAVAEVSETPYKVLGYVNPETGEVLLNFYNKITHQYWQKDVEPKDYFVSKDSLIVYVMWGFKLVSITGKALKTALKITEDDDLWL